MLGNILGRLTNEAAAGDMLSFIADAALLKRVQVAAAESSVSAGAYVAATIRHLLDHGGEEVWLDLVGKMANSPQPGVAALNAILSRAFPAVSAQACRGHGPEGRSHSEHAAP